MLMAARVNPPGLETDPRPATRFFGAAAPDLSLGTLTPKAGRNIVGLERCVNAPALKPWRDL